MAAAAMLEKFQMAISPQQLTIYLYSAHRAVIFAIAQLSCLTLFKRTDVANPRRASSRLLYRYINIGLQKQSRSLSTGLRARGTSVTLCDHKVQQEGRTVAGKPRDAAVIFQDNEGFDRTRSIAPFDPPTAKTLTLEPNMKWIG